MYKSILLISMVIAAGCSRPAPKTASAAEPAATPTAAVAPAPAAEPEPVSPAEAPPDPAPVAARPAISIPRGTALNVRLDSGVDTRRNRAGDRITGTLHRPVLVNGRTVIPAGARVSGHVTAAASSGRLQGRPVIGVTLDAIHAQGREYRLLTSGVQRVGPRHKKRNMVFIGGGTGLGAALGAIAGGGKGAAIGAAAGAGAGTAGAAATGKEEIGIASESLLNFTLREPLRIE